MNKLRMESPDMTAQNIDHIATLFPNCITEMLDEERSTPEKPAETSAFSTSVVSAPMPASSRSEKKLPMTLKVR